LFNDESEDEGSAQGDRKSEVVVPVTRRLEGGGGTGSSKARKVASGSTAGPGARGDDGSGSEGDRSSVGVLKSRWSSLLESDEEVPTALELAEAMEAVVLEAMSGVMEGGGVRELGKVDRVKFVRVAEAVERALGSLKFEFGWKGKGKGKA
jgi:hypothetical protein